MAKDISEVLESKNIRFKRDVDLSDYTTTKVGGPASYFVVCKKESDLINIFNLIYKNKFKYLIIGGGSNMLISDEGFDGVVILNRVTGISLKENKVFVKSGTLLSALVSFSVTNEFSGLEQLMGIPGTVGGAIYGHAGAYGKWISDCLERVKVSDGNKVYWLSAKQIDFSYRESSFKKDKKLILEAEFCLKKGDKKEILQNYRYVIKDRQRKYKEGLSCPGSFFKNIEVKSLDKSILSKIPSEGVLYGKVFAGFLLESVSAKGFKVGKVVVSPKHANFFVNTGEANAKDFYDLAMILKKRVFDKYGIELEPEVQIIGFNK